MSEEAVTPGAPAATAPPVAERPPVNLHRWQRVLLWPAGWLLQLWGRTLRFELDDATREAFDCYDRPVAMFLWHNRLFLSGEIIRRCRRARPFYGLISASKDGAWLAEFFRMMRISAVRGSSSRGAREAVGALLDVLRAGRDIGITPDGPRGPCYEFKPGGLIVARRANAPLILIGAAFGAGRALRSWDRFFVPVPFSRIRIRAIRLETHQLPRDRDQAIEQLTRLMREINPDAA